MPTVADNAFDFLNADWMRLSASPTATVQVAGWLVDAGVFSPADVPQNLVGILAGLERRDRALGRGHSDRWLAVLLRRAVAGDQLAARVVVQAMLPSAMRTARALKYGRLLAWGEVAATVTCVLYEVVRSYPLARRPVRIAANLSMDCRRRARRELAAEARSAQLECVEELPLSDRSSPQPCEQSELAELLAELLVEAAEAGLADPAGPVEQMAGASGELAELLLWALREDALGVDEVSVLRAHYRDQAVPDEVTAHLAGVSAAAVRKRRSRAVSRLQAAVPAWQRVQSGMAQAA